MRFPMLQNALRNVLSTEMEKVVREEKFLKDEPDRLESALRRCKKLTGTLVTLKRYNLHSNTCKIQTVSKLKSQLTDWLVCKSNAYRERFQNQVSKIYLDLQMLSQRQR